MGKLAKTIINPIGFCYITIFSFLLIRHTLIALECNSSKSFLWRFYMQLFKQQKKILYLVDKVTKIVIACNVICLIFEIYYRKKYL